MNPIEFKNKIIRQFKHLPINESNLVREFFDNKKNGFYVDIGANDPIHESQTFHLDEMGWSGLLVEPLPQYQGLLKEKRTGKVIGFACSSPENHNKVLQLTDNDGHSTLQQEWFESRNKNRVIKNIDVVCKTLDSILEENGVHPDFDFISIDIEGHEMEMLKGFDILKWHPKLILIEDHVLSHLKHNYIVSRGYKIILRTGLNSWYVPQSSSYRLTLKAKLSFIRKYWLGLIGRKIKYSR